MLNKEMIDTIAERLIIEIRIVNIFRKEWSTDPRRFNEFRPHNKIDHELAGMLQLLKAMNIECEFSYDDEVVEITAINLMGQEYKIA